MPSNPGFSFFSAYFCFITLIASGSKSSIVNPSHTLAEKSGSCSDSILYISSSDISRKLSPVRIRGTPSYFNILPIGREGTLKIITRFLFGSSLEGSNSSLIGTRICILSYIASSRAPKLPSSKDVPTTSCGCLSFIPKTNRPPLSLAKAATYPRMQCLRSLGSLWSPPSQLKLRFASLNSIWSSDSLSSDKSRKNVFFISSIIMNHEL